MPKDATLSSTLKCLPARGGEGSGEETKSYLPRHFNYLSETQILPATGDSASIQELTVFANTVYKSALKLSQQLDEKKNTKAVFTSNFK